MVTGTGWNPVDIWWYYLDDTGKVVTGWKYTDGDWYYYYSDGTMATGWLQDGNKWYYLDPSSGVMQTGCKQIDGDWYYLNEKGVMQTGTVTIDDGDHDGAYEFDSSGKWIPGPTKEEAADIAADVYFEDYDEVASVVFVKGFVDSLKKKNDDAHITFVGHSKGGAEALINAAATGKNAIVFNPAAPDFTDIELDHSQYPGKATSYVVRGEILNDHQGEEALDEVGNVIYLPQQYEFWRTNSDYSYLDEDTINLHDLEASINNHLMDAVKAALKQYDSN